LKNESQSTKCQSTSPAARRQAIDRPAYLIGHELTGVVLGEWGGLGERAVHDVRRSSLRL
jgi:hypothetical protein